MASSFLTHICLKMNKNLDANSIKWYGKSKKLHFECSNQLKTMIHVPFDETRL